MTGFTEEQLRLIIKDRLNPENWRLLEETETQLILIHKRGIRRVVKKEKEL